MPAGDNKCPTCGQWSGSGHVCDSKSESGGTDTLVGVVVVNVEDGIAYVETEDEMFDGPVRVRTDDGAGAFTVSADVVLDMKSSMAHFNDMTEDEAEDWLNTNQPEIEGYLSDAYGAELDPGSDSWDSVPVTITRSYRDPRQTVAADAAFQLSGDIWAAKMHNELNGGYQHDNFWVQMHKGASDRQIVDDDGNLSDRAFDPSSYSDSPAYTGVYGKPTRIHPPVKVRDASGDMVAFDDLPPEAQVSYADAWSNAHSTALVAIGKDPQGWRNKMIKDRQSERVRRLVTDADETTRSQAAAMRHQGRNAGIAAARFGREMGTTGDGTHAVTVVKQADRIRNNRLYDRGRDQARMVSGVTRWRQTPTGGFEGYAGGDTFYFDATDVVEVREVE